MTDHDDDPGANTAMFRAYVEQGGGPAARPSLAQRPILIGGAALVVVLVVLALVLFL